MFVFHFTAKQISCFAAWFIKMKRNNIPLIIVFSPVLSVEPTFLSLISSHENKRVKKEERWGVAALFVKNKTGCKGGGLDLWQGEPAFTRNCSRGTTKGQISSISHRATNRLVLFIYFSPHESSCHGADNVLFAHTDNLKKNRSKYCEMALRAISSLITHQVSLSIPHFFPSPVLSHPFAFTPSQERAKC